MSGRSRLILAGVAAFLACLLFFFFFVKPRQAELSKANKAIIGAKDEQQALELEKDRLEQLKANAPELNAVLEEIRGFVPQEPEQHNLQYQIQEAANLAGVGFVEISWELPKQPVKTDQLAEIRLTIRAEGGYFSIQDFLRRLYSLDRALRVDTMLIEPLTGDPTETGAAPTGETPSSGSGDVELSIAARVFFELPPGTVAGPAPDPTVPEGTVPPEETASPSGEDPLTGETSDPSTAPEESPAPTQ